MEVDGNNLCCGCLCAGRKMISIDDFQKNQCFLQIFSESPIAEPSFFPAWVCWECEANIRRFTRFKQQVQDSYTLLYNYSKQNKKLSRIQKSPRLITQKINQITFLPDGDDKQTDDVSVQVVKLENVENDCKYDIKEEYTTPHSDCNSDDDNKLLIEICKKKKKPVSSREKKKPKKKNLDVFKEINLNREEVIEERRLTRLREDYVNAMFRCERCLVSFPNAEDLKDHIHYKHELNASNYKCSICECSFSSEVSYNYHANKHTRRYQCVMCAERYNSKRGAAKHYGTVHGLVIEVEYKQKTEIENGHVTDELDVNGSKEPEVMFPCEFCNKTFRWKTSLRKHVETHRIETGQKRKPYCEPCRLSFTTTSNLQKHVKTSSKHQIQLKLRKLKELLPDDAVSAEKRRAHVEQIKCSVNSSREQFPCPQCGKRFQWRGNLLRHLHSHAARANGELVCEPCNRTFSSIATYKQHMKISKKHVSENDFKYICSECGKRFANKTRLQEHVDWEHLKNYVHTCPVCQKVFKSHTSLYLHKQVVHNKDNAEHLCDHCGKPFANQTKLRSHIIALHTNESPYKCDSCAARFSWHSCLSRHVRRVHRHAHKRRKD